VNRALKRYQVMAYLVGIGLVVLVVIGVPLQYGAGHPGVVKVVGPIHGFLYIVYLATVFDLWVKARLRLTQVIALVAAGFVPFLAFVLERRTTAQLHNRLAPQQPINEPVVG
jgi:integral membrane protein